MDTNRLAALIVAASLIIGGTGARPRVSVPARATAAATR
jgi:hypothetical protein